VGAAKKKEILKKTMVVYFWGRGRCIGLNGNPRRSGGGERGDGPPTEGEGKFSNVEVWAFQKIREEPTAGKMGGSTKAWLRGKKKGKSMA